MPYIHPIDREVLDRSFNLNGEGVFNINDPGHLNYCITKLIKLRTKNTTLNYRLFNEIVGVLECCKLELYRRLISEYEDEKIKENGDVY